VRLPVAWRVAVAGFIGAAALYGLAEGGYVNRSAQYASKSVSTLVVRAGFAVNRVTIEGQSRTRDQEIVRALGLDRDTSTLAFDTATARKRLESLPLVRRAQVMRLLPSQLHVVIEERVPYAVWQHKSALHLVDHDGTVLETLGSRTHPDLPLVVGDGAGANARDLLDELAHWPQVKQKVQASIRVANRRWNLKLANGLEIRLPENGMARALKKVAELDRTHKILSGDAVSVDLRLADRVTIRLSDSAASRRDSAFAPPAGKRRQPGQDT
jgi:cell division protein FtsQ